MYIPKYYLAIKAKIRVNTSPTSEHAILGVGWGHIGKGGGLWEFSIRMNRAK